MNIDTNKPRAQRAKALADFIAEAEWQATQDGKYPQYIGHFNGWVLCTVIRNITLDKGLAFSAGEIAICNPDRTCSSGNTYDVWSTRLAICPGVDPSAVRPHP